MATTTALRADHRANNQLRPLSGEPGVLSRADGLARCLKWSREHKADWHAHVKTL